MEKALIHANVNKLLKFKCYAMLRCIECELTKNKKGYKTDKVRKRNPFNIHGKVLKKNYQLNHHENSMKMNP